MRSIFEARRGVRRVGWDWRILQAEGRESEVQYFVARRRRWGGEGGRGRIGQGVGLRRKVSIREIFRRWRV